MTLSVGEITRRSYATVLANPRALLRCALMPTVVMLAGSALLCALEGSWAGGPARTPFTNLVLEWGPGISFTVAWLRWILLGEHRPVLSAPRFGSREIAVLALSVLLPLAAAAPIAVPLALGATLGRAFAVDVAVTILVGTVALWALVLTLRMMLVVPLVTLDAGAAAVPRSWRATRGHALAILALYILTVAPPAVVQALVPLAIDDAPGAMAWLALAVDTALSFPAGAIGTTAAALAARQLDAGVLSASASAPAPVP
jgi:hypothetical protein